MRAAIAGGFTALLLPCALGAQPRDDGPPVEVRPYVGAYLPVGALREALRTAPLLGLQIAMEVRPALHLVSGIGAARAHSKLGMDPDHVVLWSYDAGVEAGPPRAHGAAWQLRPFVGVGAGGRTYDFRSESARARRCLAGYGAAGGEMGRGKLTLRLEGRGYVSCARAPIAGDGRLRNDVGLTLGLGYHAR